VLTCSQPAGRPRLGARMFLGALALALAISAGGCGLFDTYRLETAEYTYGSPDVPAAFDGTRVVLVTDIHCGPYYTEERVGRLVDRINRLEADLVLLGGDYVYGGTEYEAPCFAQLARLEAPLGRYAVLGNHDYGPPDSEEGGPEDAIAAAAEADITLLANQAVWLEKEGQRIRLGGVVDFWRDQPQLEPITDGTRAADLVLLLCHHPDYSEELPAGVIDLVLSGHMHGGVVTLLGSWAPPVRSDYGQKYRTGIVRNGRTTVIVSNGIGTSTPLPVRFYAPAQIVILTLHSNPVASVHP
jgi:predicted MPP superfamily phosphohydrolase